MTTITPKKTILFLFALAIYKSAQGAPVTIHPNAAAGLLKTPMENWPTHLSKCFSDAGYRPKKLSEVAQTSYSPPAVEDEDTSFEDVISVRHIDENLELEGPLTLVEEHDELLPTMAPEETPSEKMRQRRQVRVIFSHRMSRPSWLNLINWKKWGDQRLDAFRLG